MSRLAAAVLLLSLCPAPGLAQGVPDAGAQRPPATSAPARAGKKKPPTRKQVEAAIQQLPTAPPARYTWDVPQIVEKVEVPGLVQGMGVPVKLHAVRSRMPLRPLMEYVRDSFMAASLYIPPPGHITKLTSDPLVTGYDPWRDIGYTAIFQPNPDGTTTVILGEAHRSERQDDAAFFAPIFPGGEGVIQSRNEGSQLLAFATTAPEPAVQKFYREQLGKQGYTEYKPMRFKKGDHQLIVQYNANPQLANGVVVSRLPYVADSLQ